MNPLPSNVLQNVSLYLRSYLAIQKNFTSLINRANKRFDKFNKVPGNLGSTVTFDSPPPALSSPGLIANRFPAQQNIYTLTVDQAANSAIAVDMQQLIFNIKNAPGGNYLTVFGSSMVQALSTTMEETGLRTFMSGVKPMTQVGDQTIISEFGNALSGPNTYYGDGINPISSYQQLEQAVMLGRTTGQAPTPADMWIPDFARVPIVNSGLGQFAQSRNNEAAQSWQIAEFGSPKTTVMQSNILPFHISGTTGIQQQVLTVVSVNDPTGNNVTQITFSGANTTDANAVRAGDMFTFKPQSGFITPKFLTQFGYFPSVRTYQFRATVTAASSGGLVTVTLSEPINWAGGLNKNCSTPIIAGMEVSTLPSHKSGGIVYGNALYLAVPELPEEWPYLSVAETDPDTKLSFMLSYGSLLGQNVSQVILYQISGWFGVPKYMDRLVFPAEQF